MTHDALPAFEDRGGAFYLHGEDQFRKEAAVRALVNAHVDPGTRDFNLDLLRGTDVTAENLASVLATPPMMAEWRVVVLREVEGLRRDVPGMVGSYLNTPWYVKQIRELTRPCEPGEDPLADPTRILCQRPFEPVRVPGQLHGRRVGEVLALATDRQLHEPGDDGGENRQHDRDDEHDQLPTPTAVSVAAAPAAGRRPKPSSPRTYTP